MNRYLGVSLCGIALLAMAGAAWAAEADKAATKPKPMTVTVKEVSGTAQRMTAGKDKKWVPLKVGEKLDEMTIIRTGFRTRVVLEFADNSVVTVDRATKMGIRQFRKEGRVTRTKLGLKYGSLRTSVEKARGPNDFTVSTPVATLAVTGSKGQPRFSGDFGFEMKSFSGNHNVKKGFRALRLVGTEGTNNRMAKSIRIVKKRITPVIGDVSGGMSKKEVKFLMNHGGGRGAVGFTGGKRTTKQIIPKKVTPKKITPTPSKPNVHSPGLDIGVG